jgi:hypothetical protein
MNKRLKESKQTLKEGKEGMGKNNNAWPWQRSNLKQTLIHLCQN